MRTYERTHPWITFQVDLHQASFRLWLLLGEAQAKCQAVTGVPLPPDVAQELQKVSLVRGARSTTAIEGNTLSEEEVRKRLDGELILPPSKAYLGQEVDNVIAAFNHITEQVQTGPREAFCLEDIFHFNRLVLNELPIPEEVSPGQVRTYEVRVGGYLGAPPEDCQYLLARLCDWLAEEFASPEEYRMAFGILKAIIAHLYIAWIHPFGDGNGRTARLMELQLLLGAGVPATAAHLLSNHYNQTRTEYYRQLERSHQAGGDPLPFVEYALQGFVDGLDEQLASIRACQLDAHWTDYLYQQFGDSPAEFRLRHLLIDLSDRAEPVPIAEIRHLSPRIAEAYADITDRTIRRDIQSLEEKGLIIRTSDGIRAHKEIVLAFQPFTP
jgi:Fic family protein